MQQLRISQKKQHQKVCANTSKNHPLLYKIINEKFPLDQLESTIFAQHLKRSTYIKTAAFTTRKHKLHPQQRRKGQFITST